MQVLLYIAAIVAAVAFLILCISLSGDPKFIKKDIGKRVGNYG